MRIRERCCCGAEFEVENSPEISGISESRIETVLDKLRKDNLKALKKLATEWKDGHQACPRKRG